jgi:acetoacetyl-CoA synthetase
MYQHFPNVRLQSISGGTDIISCFMLGTPMLPIYKGEIQAPGLGMAIESWDENAKPAIGVKGELVCVKPFVSMPVKFHNDPNGKKYHEAYFDFYEGGIWRHGDFVTITEHGGVIVYGRSDATLNPHGVRIGTAELYRVAENLSEIEDSVAIGKEEDGDVEIWLFVKLKEGTSWSMELDRSLRDHIKDQLTPRHVPARIFPVKDIPYTRSGKKVELAVSHAVHGHEIKNLTAIANPESLGEFRSLGEKYASK